MRHRRPGAVQDSYDRGADHVSPQSLTDGPPVLAVHVTDDVPAPAAAQVRKIGSSRSFSLRQGGWWGAEGVGSAVNSEKAGARRLFSLPEASADTAFAGHATLSSFDRARGAQRGKDSARALGRGAPPARSSTKLPVDDSRPPPFRARSGRGEEASASTGSSKGVIPSPQPSFGRL